MTKLLDQAVATVSKLPAADQDEIARTMLQLASRDDVEFETIDPAHISAVLEGLAQARVGHFSSDMEVAAAFRRFEP